MAMKKNKREVQYRLWGDYLGTITNLLLGIVICGVALWVMLFLFGRNQDGQDHYGITCVIELALVILELAALRMFSPLILKEYRIIDANQKPLWAALIGSVGCLLVLGQVLLGILDYYLLFSPEFQVMYIKIYSERLHIISPPLGAFLGLLLIVAIILTRGSRLDT